MYYCALKVTAVTQGQTAARYIQETHDGFASVLDWEGRAFTRLWNLTQYSIYPGINFDGVQFPFIISGYCRHWRLIRHHQTQAKCVPCPPVPQELLELTLPVLHPGTCSPPKDQAPSTGGSMRPSGASSPPRPSLPPGISSPTALLDV